MRQRFEKPEEEKKMPASVLESYTTGKDVAVKVRHNRCIIFAARSLRTQVFRFFFFVPVEWGWGQKKNPLPHLNFDLSDAERIIQVQFACIC